MDTDIRWRQRFDNYQRAFKTLESAIELAATRELSDLEKQGVIQGFEFTHQLAWNVLKDYLEEQGETDILGSKDAIRLAFKTGLIESGDDWMLMIKARNLSSHTYNVPIANDVFRQITTQFYPAFIQMNQTFSRLYNR